MCRASADTIVPDLMNPQSFNRYSYGLNNPVRYTDPTGHYVADASEAVYDCNDTLDCQTTVHRGNFTNYIRPCHHSLDCIYPPGHEQAGHYILSNPVEAYGIGISGTAGFDTPIASVNLVAGREEVFVPSTGNRTTFVFGGGEVKVGPNGGFIDWLKRFFLEGDARPNVSVSPYVAFIHNVDNVVEDYSGPVVSSATTLAWGKGVTWGQTAQAHEIGLAPTDRIAAYSKTFGLTAGYALNVDVGTVTYIPVMTREQGQFLPTIHWQEAIDILFGGQ